VSAGAGGVSAGAGGVKPELRRLDIADPPELWEALGFSVTPDEWNIDGNNSPRCSTRACDIGGVRLRLGARGHGITKWTLTGIPGDTASIDGLLTDLADGRPAPTPAKHPNGALAIDHVVVTTPHFDRTAEALEGAGMQLRRVAERPDGGRMGFRRLGPAILELVEADAAGAGPARFWGLVVVVHDLGALADGLGGLLGSIRDAVQPGRRIATLRESAGLGEAVAFMSPE
jgi:hypothetical protein